MVLMQENIADTRIASLIRKYAVKLQQVDWRFSQYNLTLYFLKNRLTAGCFSLDIVSQTTNSGLVHYLRLVERPSCSSQVVDYTMQNAYNIYRNCYKIINTLLGIETDVLLPEHILIQKYIDTNKTLLEAYVAYEDYTRLTKLDEVKRLGNRNYKPPQRTVKEKPTDELTGGLGIVLNKKEAGFVVTLDDGSYVLSSLVCCSAGELYSYKKLYASGVRLVYDTLDNSLKELVVLAKEQATASDLAVRTDITAGVHTSKGWEGLLLPRLTKYYKYAIFILSNEVVNLFNATLMYESSPIRDNMDLLTPIPYGKKGIALSCPALNKEVAECFNEILMKKRGLQYVYLANRPSLVPAKKGETDGLHAVLVSQFSVYHLDRDSEDYKSIQDGYYDHIVSRVPVKALFNNRKGAYEILHNDEHDYNYISKSIEGKRVFGLHRYNILKHLTEEQYNLLSTDFATMEMEGILNDDTTMNIRSIPFSGNSMVATYWLMLYAYRYGHFSILPRLVAEDEKSKGALSKYILFLYHHMIFMDGRMGVEFPPEYETGGRYLGFSSMEKLLLCLAKFYLMDNDVLRGGNRIK